MNGDEFAPTPQQQEIIDLDGAAFVTACPGAGKTRVMVERARHLLRTVSVGRGIALLSFTKSAVSELETRLRQETIVQSPVFPSFIGTFDGFIWQFLVSPFGMPGSDARPRLIPDVGSLEVKPYPDAQPLPLSCFDEATAEIDQATAKQRGFDTTKKTESKLRSYKTAATKLRSRLREKGCLGFAEARAVALDRLTDGATGRRIVAAISSRFCEVIVDEAQDCNPDDLRIITALREAGLPVKVICDPDQSIYSFRFPKVQGGLSSHLIDFEKTFKRLERKVLSGNFRSSPNICKAIAMLRRASAQGQPDQALGDAKDETIPVYILSYSGSVSGLIAEAYTELVHEIREHVSACPVLASTKESGTKTVGLRDSGKRDATYRLAKAVMDFQFASGFQNIRSALEDVHRIVLKIDGHLSESSYHEYLSDNELDEAIWRPAMVRILRELRFDPDVHSDARNWHRFAKETLTPLLSPAARRSVSQKLKWNSALDTLLTAVPAENARARTIHSVKGMKFPAVCVVMTTQTTNRILDFLETGSPPEQAENAQDLRGGIESTKVIGVCSSKKPVDAISNSPWKLRRTRRRAKRNLKNQVTPRLKVLVAHVKHVVRFGLPLCGFMVRLRRD